MANARTVWFVGFSRILQLMIQLKKNRLHLLESSTYSTISTIQGVGGFSFLVCKAGWARQTFASGARCEQDKKNSRAKRCRHTTFENRLRIDTYGIHHSPKLKALNSGLSWGHHLFLAFDGINKLLLRGTRNAGRLIFWNKFVSASGQNSNRSSFEATINSQL